MQEIGIALANTWIWFNFFCSKFHNFSILFHFVYNSFFFCFINKYRILEFHKAIQAFSHSSKLCKNSGTFIFVTINFLVVFLLIFSLVLLRSWWTNERTTYGWRRCRYIHNTKRHTHAHERTITATSTATANTTTVTNTSSTTTETSMFGVLTNVVAS